MPSKKKKYNARFPPARIKKIMQTDEDVGKVAAAVPVIISRALELFIESLILKASETTRSRSAKTLSTAHIKHIIQSDKRFDFLKDLVANIPDIQQGEDEAEGITSPPDPKPEGSRPRGRPRKKKPDGVDALAVTKRPRKYVRKPAQEEDDEETDSATEEDQEGSEGDQDPEDMDEDAEDDHEDNGECGTDEDSDHASDTRPTSSAQCFDAPGPSHQVTEPMELAKNLSAPSHPQTVDSETIQSETVAKDCKGSSDSIAGDNPEATQDVGIHDQVPSDNKPDPDHSSVPKTENDFKTEPPACTPASGNPLLSHPPQPFYPGMLPSPSGFYGDPRFMPPMFPNNHVQQVQSSVETENIKPKRKRRPKKGKSDIAKHERTNEAGGSHMDPNQRTPSFGMIPPVCVPMTTGYFPTPGMPMPPYFAGGPMPGFHPAMMNYPPMAMPQMVHPGMGGPRMGLPFPQHIPPMMDPRFQLPDMKTAPVTSTSHPSNHLPPEGSSKAAEDNVLPDPQARASAGELDTPVDLKMTKAKMEDDDYDS